MLDRAKLPRSSCEYRKWLFKWHMAWTFNPPWCIAKDSPINICNEAIDIHPMILNLCVVFQCKIRFPKQLAKWQDARWKLFLIRRSLVPGSKSQVYKIFHDNCFPFFCALLCCVYRQTYNISRTKSQCLNVFRLVLQLDLSNPLMLCATSRVKM